jgi:hypothetical protein
MYVNFVNCLNTPSSDHTIPSSSPVSRVYVNLVNYLNTLQLIILSHFLHPCLQSVRELDRQFDYSSSDHPTPPSSSVSRKYVNFVSFLRCLIRSSNPIVSRMYVNLFNYSNTSHLIVLSHPLHPSPERT